MKLSVCIPIYNVDVRNLVSDLLQQIKMLDFDAEIILIDDASDSFYTKGNLTLKNQVTHFVTLEKNIGRSRIRNLFLEYAAGEFLLFLDCDVQIISSDFISNYLKTHKKYPETDVFYGSFNIYPPLQYTLRNRYSAEREIFYGNKSWDYKHFKTVNFMIRKTLFKRIHFDEHMRFYGYEDYIFGCDLASERVPFLAFQNPVLHIDDSSAEEFLKKTAVAVQTLHNLESNPKYTLYLHKIKLYRWSGKLEKWGLKSIFLKFYRIIERKLIAHLCADNPYIIFLDIYKLNLILKNK